MKHTALLAAAGLVAAGVARSLSAQVPVTTDPGDFRHHFTFAWENDALFNADRYYTNGASLAWTTAKSPVPDRLSETAIPLFEFGRGEEVRASSGLALAQLMAYQQVAVSREFEGQHGSQRYNSLSVGVSW